MERDADGSVPMETFVELVREHFRLPEPAGELWRACRARLPHLVSCRPEALTALDRLRTIWVDRGVVTEPPGTGPDHVVTDVVAAVDWLMSSGSYR
ncbi:hypothetical protein E1267_08735 [Nonomuraea longispora]|uniref:Uncharacterized protein n=1 Tax=Nonomuraea longispora TaxID=1848320 RepID=A0A4R4NIM7_9ACTN|nr:hypothetical protein [Nonomuraea longispora]TDC08925.1 hypothetical protein E1267_08735 [Nonomuraea longispora]